MFDRFSRWLSSRPQVEVSDSSFAAHILNKQGGAVTKSFITRTEFQWPNLCGDWQYVKSSSTCFLT